MHVPERLHQPSQPTRIDMHHRQTAYGWSTFPSGLLKYEPLPKRGNSLRLVSANSQDTAGQTGTLCSTPALACTGSTENETYVSRGLQNNLIKTAQSLQYQVTSGPQEHGMLTGPAT